MRRWTDMSKNVMEDDPMRGYEQFRIYDPIRGYQNEEIEPYDKSFLETYSKIESLMQRGGLNKNEIITVENRDRYVGQVIEIVPIHVFDDHLIDDSGGEEIKNFMNKICKIANTDQYDIDYYGDNITNVSIDIEGPSGIEEFDGFILRIPRNLQELEDDLNSTNPRYLYYVRLGNQGPPIREEDARKELLLELQEDEVDDNPDSPVLPNEYQRAKQALVLPQ